jgi:hypothetical protein
MFRFFFSIDEAVAADSECEALCGRTAGCVSWQWMYSDHTCWLKDATGVYGINGDSSSGMVNCSAAYWPVQVMAFAGSSLEPQRWIILNSADTPLTITLVATAATRTGMHVFPASAADAYRANITVTELSHQPVELTAGATLLSLPAFSITTLS